MKNIILILLIALVFLIACTQQKIDGQTKPDVMIEKSTDVMEKEASMEKGENNYQGEILAGSLTPYLEFNEADYQKAQAENKIILLNFYANWCPICKAEESKAYAAYNELKLENVVAFRVNYKDSQTDSFEESLAQKFQIPYQHTKVIIKDGKQILKTPDSWDKARYIKKLNSLA